MTTLLLAILFPVLAPQDTRIVGRTEKTEYNAALLKYKEAEATVTSDPLGCIEKLNDILSNSKIRILECVLKIEQRPAEYSDPYPFLPYQLRGSARVNQSKKLSGEAAQRMMAAALEDYTESSKRGVESSAALVKTAQARLAQLKEDMTASPLSPGKTDPLLLFRGKWDPLMREGRFASARAAIDKYGQDLSPEQKKGFLQNADQQCRDYLTKEASDFRFRFIGAMNLGLEQKTSDEFDLTFSLPDPAELVVSNPAIDWARQYLPAFRDVQQRKLPASSLAAAAVASVPLEDRFENPWFKAVEAAIFLSLRSALADVVEKARNAPRAEREKDRAQADGLFGVWKGMMSKLDAKFVERHRFLSDHERQLTRSLDAFPVELAELEKVAPSIDAAFSAEAPDVELGKIEETLSGLESKSNLSLESRRLLYTSLVTVASLRGLLAGKSEDAVAGDLSAYRQKLREAGGPADASVKKYGPRVEKVFGALR